MYAQATNHRMDQKLIERKTTKNKKRLGVQDHWPQLKNESYRECSKKCQPTHKKRGNFGRSYTLRKTPDTQEKIYKQSLTEIRNHSWQSDGIVVCKSVGNWTNKKFGPKFYRIFKNTIQDEPQNVTDKDTTMHQRQTPQSKQKSSLMS